MEWLDPWYMACDGKTALLYSEHIPLRCSALAPKNRPMAHCGVPRSHFLASQALQQSLRVQLLTTANGAGTASPTRAHCSTLKHCGVLGGRGGPGGLKTRISHDIGIQAPISTKSAWVPS